MTFSKSGCKRKGLILEMVLKGKMTEQLLCYYVCFKAEAVNNLNGPGVVRGIEQHGFGFWVVELQEILHHPTVHVIKTV